MEGTINPNYRRAVPRDLFNEALFKEAKLLKCLGRLSLLIHEGKMPYLVIKVTNPTKPFTVSLHSAGYLVATPGLQFLDNDAAPVWLGTLYNSQNSWPLVCYTDEGEELTVFTEEGELTEEFVEYCIYLAL
jgi:hypothetical protein